MSVQDATSVVPGSMVSAWVHAFNARDADRLLAYLHPDVEFHPIRLAGIAAAYHGHDGVRRWLAELERAGHRHRIELSDVRAAGDGQVLASGLVTTPGGRDGMPFCALYSIIDGRIGTARHYLSTPDMLEALGLLL